ncbi:uncharacterized protein LOC113679046 [Pocillopora damicornis]|uniref:uncharacterized protein LOC113679046 n=1 Tax=Pocillopora damicornis TaxID=46731 RepID=UPI000F550C0B|nr:uncharacterized protein LOC113679046 [Pocillopora damicornis]
MAEPSATVIEDVNKAMIRANSGEDKNETALLMMSPSMNWAEFLTPAPMSIALLGQLMLIAGEKDFSLESQKPKDGFQFIQHPRSFRACLVQVSNAGWRAFNEAHKNMDTIRLYSAKVPEQVKKVVRTLVSGSKEDVKDILPIELRKIEENASESLELAKAVESKFENVMHLTGELLEVSSAAKGHFQNTQVELQTKREIALTKEKSVREEIERAKEEQDKLTKQVKEAKAQWEKAVDSMPSGWDLVGMQFVEGITKAFTSAAETVISAVATRGMNSSSAPSHAAPNLRVDPSEKQSAKRVSKLPTQALVKAELMKVFSAKLVEVLATFQDKSNGGEPAKDIKKTRLEMESLQKDWSTEQESKDDQEGLKLLSRGLEICMEAEKELEDLNLSNDKMKKIAKRASKLKDDIFKFCTKVQTKVQTNPLYTKPPRQARNMADPAKSASSSAANMAVESARFKIAETRGLLEKQEMLYDEGNKQLKESNKELSKVLQSLVEFSPEKIANFDQIRETLKKGIKALASVRERWQKLVEFFQCITNIIKVCQKESLTSFVEYSKVAQERRLTKGYTDTDFMRDLIYEQVSQANKTSYVVWSISNTYVEVSRNHLMSRLASLGHLIALDPEKDRATIEEKRIELLEGSQEAERAIMQLVSEAQNTFHEKVGERIKQFEEEMEKVLPPEDPARIKEINDSVAKAVKEADEELSADCF